MTSRIACTVLLATLLAAAGARAATEDFPPEAESTVIGIVAFRFAWVTQYPGPDGKLGRFHESLVTKENPHGRDLEDPAGKDDVLFVGTEIFVPADKPVIAHGTSVDNLHGFTLKAFKLDEPLVPGVVRRFWFRPVKPGKATILCANYCGEGHDEMKGILRMLPRADFDAWLAERARAP